MLLLDAIKQLDALLGTGPTGQWGIRRDSTSSPLPVAPDKLSNLLGGVPKQWQSLYLWHPGGEPIVDFWEVGASVTSRAKGTIYQVKLDVPGGTDPQTSVWVTLELSVLHPLTNLPSLETKLAELYSELENELWNENS